MKILHCNLSNCYGIKNLQYDFDFKNKPVVIIYAPNGTMKTSFAKTFRDLSQGKEPKDCIYKDNITTCDIKIDEELKQIKPEIIYVADPDDKINSEGKITTFLARKELKEKYDSIHLELNRKKETFFKKLKEISKCSDPEHEIIEKFGNSNNKNIYTLLRSIAENSKDVTFHNFDYNIIFDKKGNVKKFIESNKLLLKQYFQKYNELFTKSELFALNNKNINFGTYQAKELIKAVEDNSYFGANHTLVLKNGKVIKCADELNCIYEKEIERILTNEELQKKFKKIDDALSKSQELRLFKEFIEKNQNLIPYIIDYETFRLQVWHNNILLMETDYLELINDYKLKEEELDKLVYESRKDDETWEKIIGIYKNRFQVPFEIEITNQEDIILRQETPHLNFIFHDKQGNKKECINNEDDFIPTLSRGELRAFYILQLLFELESRKLNNHEQLLILDDISDSFDYKNKYAIIEYIFDFINENEQFKQIILTHNFDFYRSVASRLGISNLYMAYEKENGNIQICNGKYIQDIFSKSICKKPSNDSLFPNDENLISMIPFTRNLIEYRLGTDSEEYKILTCCMHLKIQSTRITTKKVFELIKKNVFKYKKLKFDESKNIGIIKFIMKTADNIASEICIDPVKLENKIVLSIAIRLKAESYLKRTLKMSKEELACITTDQTKYLIDKYKKFNKRKIKNVRILDAVNLMTPENIHLNNFMFEPLVDMSVIHLVKLYKNVKMLNNRGWKFV